MEKIKSIEDLKRIREEAIEKKQLKEGSNKILVVGMGTIGIASGARDIVKTILDFIEEEKLIDVIVKQAGNLGHDSFEPLVQVNIADQPTILYGNVTADAMRKIMKEHVVEGKIVKEYCLSTIEKDEK